jgi:hypothetical protein
MVLFRPDRPIRARVSAREERIELGESAAPPTRSVWHNDRTDHAGGCPPATLTRKCRVRCLVARGGPAVTCGKLMPGSFW